MKNRGLFAIFFGMAVMSFTVFNSCDLDIGLGSAVDTEVPTLKIDNPPTSAVIRDVFRINGTWEDDGTIDKIKVELKDTNPDVEHSFSFDGKLEGGNTWGVSIDPIKAKIPDGKYEATITIRDNSGHHSTTARSFVIDNTPPVVILERPSTIASDDDSDLFGQKFTLKGQSADNNDISRIRVNFYEDKECKIYRHHVDLEKIPPTIDMDVATFKLNVDNDYAKIYKSTAKDGKKSLYFTIEAYDGASRYNGVDPVDKSGFDGNKSEIYYPYESVYQYKATDLYNILSRTYVSGENSRDVSSIDYSAVVDLLKKEKNKVGRFSLNPANNPEFKVVGRASLTKDGTDFSKTINTFSNESNISLKVAKGLDAIPLVKDSLKIYLLPCDEKGDISIEDKYIIDENKRVYTNRIYPPADSVTNEPGDGGYTLTVKIIADNTVDYKGESSPLSIGETYIIAIEGYDQEGNEVVAEDGNTYGFKLAPNGAAPIVEIKTCVNPVADSASNKFIDDAMIYVPRYNPADTSKESEIRFEGTVQVADGTPTLEVKIDNEAPANSKVTLTPVAGHKGLFSFVYTVPVNKFKNPEKSIQHNIVFEASLQDTTQVKKSIMYQVDKPKITLSRVEPLAYKYLNEAGDREKDSSGKTKQFLNGKNVKLNVTIIAGAVGLNEEDEDKKAIIEFFQKDSAGKFTVNKLTIDAPTFGETPAIDTTKFEDDELLVRITAFDMAGNKSILEEKFFVDQSTDIPCILPKNSQISSLTFTKEQAQDLSNSEINVYFGNQTVLYKLIDDDGLVQAKYQIFNASDGSLRKEETFNKVNGATEYQMEVTMPNIPGTYRIHLETRDLNSIENTGADSHSESKNFFIRVTADAPTIEEITNVKSIYNGSDKVTPSVQIKSDQVPFTVLRVVKDSAGKEIADLEKTFTKDDNSILNTESPKFEDEITISDGIDDSGDYTVFYKIKDKNSRWSEEYKKTFTVDLIPPVIDWVKIADSLYDESIWNNSKTLALQVKASDAHFSTVEYSLNNSVFTALSGKEIYSGTAVFTKEGAVNSLYIRATDTAGNVTYYNDSSINVRIDTSAPNLSAKYFKLDNQAATAKLNSINVKKNTKLTVYGNYDDVSNGSSLSGVGELSFVKLPEIAESKATVKYSTTSIGDSTSTIPADSEYKKYSDISDKSAIRSWKVEFTPKASGEFSIKGSDLVSSSEKNTTAELKVFDITYDETAPVLNITRFESIDEKNTYKDVYQNSDNGIYYANNTNKTFKLSGTATDDIAGVNSVVLNIKGTINGTEKTITLKRTENVGQWIFDNIDIKSFNGSGAEFVIIATDKAGNEYEKKLEIAFDVKGPESKHDFDFGEKDIYFRIGDYNNDAADTGNTTDAYDNDVGGKYSKGTYAKATSLIIRGYFDDEENGSGINQYYYKVYESSEKIAAFANDKSLIEDVINDSEKGTFKPLSINEEKRVYYSINGTERGKREKVVSNYRTSISNLSNGSNYVVIVAEDNVGNRSIDKVNDTEKYYYLNVDTTIPKISKVEGEQITQNKNVTLTVTMEEEHPDKPEVVIKKNGTEIKEPSATVGELSGSGSAWTCAVTIPFSNNKLDDDTYTIEVRAKDKAKNPSDPVSKTIVKDTKAPVVKITKPAAASDTFEPNNSYKFEGTITELNELKSVTARLYKDGASTAEQTTTLSPMRVNGKADEWKWSWQVYGLKESDYYIEIEAKDAAENDSEKRVSKKIKIDNTAPKVKVTAIGLKDSEFKAVNNDNELTPNATYYAGESYEITVEVEDVNFDTAKTNLYSIEPKDTCKIVKTNDKKFSFKPETYKDGTFTYKIYVEDMAGNKADPVIFKVQRDTTSPEVEILSPAKPEEGKISLVEGKSYSFRISVKDKGVGVKSIAYAFSKEKDVSNVTDWGPEEPFSDGEKVIEKKLISGKEEDAGKLCEGDWYLYVKATDKSGIKTVNPICRAFTVDLAKPDIEVENLKADGVRNIISDEVDDEGYKLKIKASDSNAIAKNNAIQVKVENESLTETDGNWIISKEKLKKNDSTTVTITVYDSVGKSTEENFILYYDTNPPTLEITAPVDDESVASAKKVIKGTVSDDGYGIDRVDYTLYSKNKDGTEKVVKVTDENGVEKDVNSTNFPLEIKGEQWYIKDKDAGMALGSKQGTLILKVTAVEKKNGTHGGREKTESKTFYYDEANPELEENLIETKGKTTNKAFKLGGKAWDTNELDRIEIICDGNIWTSENPAPTPKEGEIPKKSGITLVSEENKYNWSAEFVVGSTHSSATNYISDGTKEFTIVAYDIAGNQKQLTRTVVVDTVAPTCGTPSITSTGNKIDAITWYNTSFIDIKLENVEDKGDSGISKVEYSINKTVWYPMSGSGKTYKATVNCTPEGKNTPQGKNTIYVRVLDGADNIKEAGTLTPYIDTKAPTLDSWKVKYLEDGTFEAASELLINGSNGYQLQLEATDTEGGDVANNSGIASVTYYYKTDSNNITVKKPDSDGYWKITVPLTNGTDQYDSSKTNAIYAIITDNAGNEIKERVLTVTKDITKPNVEIVSFTRAGSTTTVGSETLDNVNGTITISGTASDTNKFGNVKLEYQKSKTDTWTEIATSTDNSWTTTLNTKNLTDNTKYTIRATATDAAGNTKEATQAIYVNQDSDRPVITVTNMTLATVANEISFLKRTSRLEGTVSDDDGNVTKLEYSTNGTTWTKANLEYGTAWSIANLPEGDNKLYFKVTDSVNATPFVTALEDSNVINEAANQPKIKDANNTYVTHTQGSLALNFMVVTKQPDVDEKQYVVYNSSTQAWETRENLGTLGGVYTKFKVSLKAKAEASIQAVQAKYSTDAYEIEFTCDDANHSNNAYHTWRTDEIELDNSKTELKLKVSDASSTTDPMTLEQTITYSVDNTAPTVNIKAPSSTAGVKETMQFDMSEAATSYYAVTLSTVTANDTTGAPLTEPTWTQIVDTSNGLTRYVFFDDGTETDHTERFALYLTETSTNSKHLGITTLAKIEATSNPYETITPVKFWVKSVDSCGNIGYASKEVNVDPQGNRPAVTLNSPVNVLNQSGQSVPPTLGGTIRIDGNVADDKGAKFVWLQIARSWTVTNEDDNTTTAVSKPFNGEALKYLVGKGYSIGNMTNNTDVSATTINALANNATVSDYAIKVPVTGTAWNLSINGNQEFNEAAEVDIVFTIYATDADTDNQGIVHIHRSAPITQSIKIDSRTPYINPSELYLVKYNGNTEVARKEYKEGEDVDGIWYLQGKIKDDDSGLKTVSYKKNNAATYTEVITEYGGNVNSVDGDTHFYFKKVAHKDDATKYDYDFSVPLGSSTADQVGTDSIQIKAVENTGQNLNTDPTFTVTFDNKAPVFNTNTDNVLVKLSSDIYNSSGFYTFGAIASEDDVKIGEKTIKQSGVERIAFYFTRDLNYSLSELTDGSAYNEHTNEKDSKTNDLFDVMIYHSNGDSADVTSGNMIVNYKGKAEGTSATLSYSEGLYWRTHEGTASGKTFTYTGAIDPNIHAGGLVKINGVIYKIESVSGQTVTIPSNISEASSALFALCNVIDNSGEKNGSSTSSTHGYGFGYYGSRVTDDGDLITETFNSQGTEWIFDASINSRNLPDGPITLHMVAFDKAGNVTTTPFTMNGTVKNNAPRIAGLILGTDENGNGRVDEGEFVSAYSGKFVKGYDTAGNEMHDVSFPVVPNGGTQTSLLTVKGLTVVKPEIIGGNGAISYSYQVKTDETWGKEVSGGALAKDGTGNVFGTTDDVVAGSITLPLEAFIGSENGEDKKLIPDGTLSNFRFTFGDSTPGISKTDTTGKNRATMSVFLDVALRETTKARNWILPFYWKSASDNSLFNQSKDNGHIELAKDWVATAKYSENAKKAKNQQKAEFDADPKVSGKIKIEGIAQDDTLLREIKVQFGKSMGGLGTTNTTIATYNTTRGNWTTTALTATTNTANGVTTTTYSIPTGTGWASAIQQATYQDLKDVGIITEIPEDKEPTSKVPYTSQDYGHVVHWILYLDTEKVTGVANTDVTVTAIATDRGTPKWNSTTNAPAYTANAAETTGGTAISGAVTKSDTEVSIAALTGNYRVDFVPYITQIVTHLSPYSQSTPSVYARTALGKYPVYEGETIQFVGFNLGANTASVTVNGMNATTLKNGTINNESGNPNTITLTKGTGTGAKSGDITLTVNNIPALNNYNNNDAKGSYSGNIEDDTYAHAYNRQPNGVNNNILDDNVSLDVWQFLNAAEPRNGKSDNPTMKISSQGRIGISYSNAVVYFSAPLIGYNKAQNRDNIYSQTAIAQNYGWFTNNTFCFDQYGYPYAAAQSPDTDTATGAAFLQFFSRRTGKSINDMGLNENYQKIANSSRIEAICIPINADENDWTTDIDRTQSICMATSMPYPTTAPNNDNNKVTIHMAYWDNLTKQIRYRQGKVGENPADFGFKNGNNYGGSLLDLQGINSSAGTQGGRYNSAYDSVSSKNGKDAVKNQHIYRVAGTSLGTDYANAYQVTTAKQGGKYVDIGVLPTTATSKKPTVVLCWYDGQAKKLVVSYDTPSDSDTAKENGMYTGNWQSNALYIGTRGGMYCRMAIDGDDGIHIAHYDYLSADLLYTYIPTVNGVPQLASATTITVDSYLSVGTWCTIDVAKELKTGSTTEYNYVPQIGYFTPASEDSTAAARIAKATKFDANGRPLYNGAVNDKFTGAWEISIVPTEHIPIIDRVNVGMHKNANGVLIEIPTGGKNRKAVDEVNKPGYPVSDSTTVYGNGTTNPAVVYCLDDGPVELAQKK